MSAACLNGFTVVSYQQPDAPNRRYAHISRTFLPTSSIVEEADRKLRNSIDELLELRRLGNNWDGEGAAAPLPELVDSAISYLTQRNIPIAPSRIVPVNDGRITLEWDFIGLFVSIRIQSPNQGRIMLVKPDGKTEFSEISLSGK